MQRAREMIFYQTNMIFESSMHRYNIAMALYNLKEFIRNQISLLEKEREFDKESQAEEKKKYGSIYGKVINQSVPPYFGVTVTFRLKITGEQGTGNPFKQGSPIIIEVISTKEKFQGTVMLVRPGEIDVHIKVSANSVTFKPGSVCICELEADDCGEFDLLIRTMGNLVNRPTKIRDVLLWFRRPKFTAPPQVLFIDQELDQSQQAAVRHTLQQKDLALIHGPPGTGKTRTLVEIIRQELRDGGKVLFAAASNTAVDNMAERLESSGVNIIRLGNPAKVTDKIQHLTLDYILCDEFTLFRDLQYKVTQTKYGSADFEELEYQVTKQGAKLGRLINEQLVNAAVVLGTFMCCSDSGPLQYLPRSSFTLTLVDESSQAKEASVWVLEQRTQKLVLAGDFHQLPPTVHKRALSELERSMFERLWRDDPYKLTKCCAIELKHQYRMNDLIMRWPSARFYQGKLIAAPSVANCSLSDLDSVTETQETREVLYLIDTSKITGNKYEERNNKSCYNKVEAVFVIEHLKKLLDAGVRSEDIGIVTPYSAQRELLAAELQEDFPDLEIKSVDGFQGREKEAIILSMVRSNNQDVVGFLGDKRRLNVAITRAKKQLTVICDSETVGSDPLLAQFLQYLKGSRKNNKNKNINNNNNNNKRAFIRRPGSGEVQWPLLKGTKYVSSPSKFDWASFHAHEEEIDRSKIVSIDCEMGESADGLDILTKVAIVNHEKTLFNSFVKNDIEVVDLRTKFSGVRAEDLKGAPHIDDVIPQVRNIINDASIIVGHGLDHDMEVLGFRFPEDQVRDTSLYGPFVNRRGRTPGLKSLVKKHLGYNIQLGEHDPVEDARAALYLYLKER